MRLPSVYYAPLSASRVLPAEPCTRDTSVKFLIASCEFLFDPSFSAISYIGAQYWVLNKAEMLSGCTAPTPCPGGRNIDAATNTVNPAGSNGKSAIRPAQHLSPTPILTLSGDTTPTASMAETCLTVTSLVLTNHCPTS